MPQCLLRGKLKESRHIGFGVFIVHSSMALLQHTNRARLKKMAAEMNEMQTRRHSCGID
jgi:hypothetical protein